ncbi:MAG: hypothetical protein ACRCZ9_00855 [Fusobacteriaceae bacterium]
MLKNIKIKDLLELNSEFGVEKENNVCKNNHEFTLPLLFKNYYMEKILVLNNQCNIETVISITYDEVLNDDNRD